MEKKSRNQCNLGEPFSLSFKHEDSPPENEVKNYVNTTSIAKRDYAGYLIRITEIYSWQQSQ